VGFNRYFHLGGFDATRELTGLCPITTNSHVLDVGCATGKTACYLAQTIGCRVTGIDILPKMVERALERASRAGLGRLVDFQVGDAQDLAFDDHLFDIVLAEWVTGLVADSEAALREYVRVARAGGTIAISDGTLLQTPLSPELASFVERTLGFNGRILTGEDWSELLAACGIKELATRVFQAESLGSRGDDLWDLLRALPKVMYCLVRRPKLRNLLKASAAIPDDFFEYVGYGLYVGFT
jgi:SAM-dependent methyltransferase